MDIKDLLKLENMRVLLVYLSLYLIGRSVYYLVIDEPFAYFANGRYQEMFQQILDIDIPMVALTIMWPLILTFLTLLHDNLRLAPGLFYSVIGSHTLSCLIAAYLVYSWDTSVVYIGNAHEVPTMNAVLLVTAATITTSIVSVFLYRIRYKLNDLSA